MKPSRFYATILTDVANGQAGQPALQTVTAELTTLAAAMKESPLLSKVLMDPTISENERAIALNALKQKMGLSDFTNRFLLIMSKRSRLGLLAEVLEEISVIVMEKAGGVIGELTSAEALDATTVETVAAAVGKKLNKKVALKQRVDPSLIAGMRVNISGMTYDGSVRAKLNRAQEAFR